MSLAKMFLGMGIVAVLGCAAAPLSNAVDAKPQEPQAPYDPSQSPDQGKVEGKGWTAVQKLLKVHCEKCHGENGRGGFDARTYEAVMKGYDDGKLVIPGDPEKSPLIHSLRGKKDIKKMPPRRGIPLSEEQIKAFEQWIKDGAKKE